MRRVFSIRDPASGAGSDASAGGPVRHHGHRRPRLPVWLLAIVVCGVAVWGAGADLPHSAPTSPTSDAGVEKESHPEVVPPPPPNPSSSARPPSSSVQRPPQGPEVHLPIQQGIDAGKIDLSGQGNRISLMVREASIGTVLQMIAERHGLNIVTGENVQGTVSMTLTDVALEDALDAILRVNGYTWVRDKGMILVTRIDKQSVVPPMLQGRQLRVFSLNYLGASDAHQVVQSLLSPVGQSMMVAADPKDKSRTRDQLVVEDLPEYLARVEAYLAQSDRPPLQVLIEASVLQVELSDDCRYGVELQRLATTVCDTQLTFRSAGGANAASSPAYFLGIDGADLGMLIEALKATNDTKTLASPKVLVVNGQESRIQVGGSFGYLTTTTTQTATVQNVNFMEVGVLLSVTPKITEDGRILMTVRPEVSDGAINETTGLPDKKTTEVETTLLLADGQGMVIGGLIQERDIESQTKVPWLGDLWLIGLLFQRRSVERERSEIIVTLTPHLVPLGPDMACREQAQYCRATSHLVGPQLERIDRRPLEPELPDALHAPCWFDHHQGHHGTDIPCEPPPPQVEPAPPSDRGSGVVPDERNGSRAPGHAAPTEPTMQSAVFSALPPQDHRDLLVPFPPTPTRFPPMRFPPTATGQSAARTSGD
jgi:hypothetical protein